MYLDFFFGFTFLAGIYFILDYRINISKALHACKHATFPLNQNEFSAVLIPDAKGWSEMIPLSAQTSSYKKVKWGTVVAITILVILLVFTNYLDRAFLSMAYLFFLMIESTRHPGNLYIADKGIVLHCRYIPATSIKHYRTEKIVKWHSLYGIDTQVNNAYKLTFKMNKSWQQSHYVVIKNFEELEKITRLLGLQGIPRVQKSEHPYPSSANG
ncbi:hypothetical protein [Bacillus massilinigeriensis]|uniref:hypothetical protein n=1 Tax=Bacillus mediterraneensis TaxID=1805474 RepID=UPI0008F8EE73|nr:hypothetical protein [Bacillus mediterraneensis]